jgi:hypothetical protein
MRRSTTYDRNDEDEMFMNMNEDTCRICSQTKPAHLFCCTSCWRSLPHELRAPFAIAKLRALSWLRARAAEQSKATIGVHER